MGCPSSPLGSLKLIYFVKVIPFPKAETRPIAKSKNDDRPHYNCLKQENMRGQRGTLRASVVICHRH